MLSNNRPGDGCVKQRDLQQLHGAMTFKDHSDTVQSIAFSALGNQLMTGGKDGLVRLWDVFRRQELLALLPTQLRYHSWCLLDHALPIGLEA